MARPAVHATTELLYATLPEVYRTHDEDRPDGPDGYPLLRFLDLIGEQFGEVRDVIERADYYARDDGGVVGDTSDLADPATADAAWLPWLAQLVGANVERLSTAAMRDAIPAAFQAGSAPAIRTAARTALTGTKTVTVHRHYQGDIWRVEVRVRASELVSNTAAVLAAILAADVKPAGVELVITTVEVQWDTLEAQRPTWNDIDGSTWTELEETGAP